MLQKQPPHLASGIYVVSPVTCRSYLVYKYVLNIKAIDSYASHR